MRGSERERRWEVGCERRGWREKEREEVGGEDVRGRGGGRGGCERERRWEGEEVGVKS